MSWRLLPLLTVLVVACASGTFEVLKRVDGRTTGEADAESKCDKVSNYTKWYFYDSELDKVGHQYGVASSEWLVELQLIDSAAGAAAFSVVAADEYVVTIDLNVSTLDSNVDRIDNNVRSIAIDVSITMVMVKITPIKPGTT